MVFRIGLIGKGKVGTCFLQLLKEKKKIIRDNFNIECIITAVFERDGALINCDGLNIDEVLNNYPNLKESDYWKPNIKATDSVSELDLDLCIEVTPTNPLNGEPALTHIIKALSNGIDVISSNKAPFYLEYNKIIKLAQQKKCIVRYEATVGSCIPALSIKENLLGTTILTIYAILNGTNNFILSRMTAEGIPFATALKEAQELGYAETDPSLDINGYDTAGKIVILANDLLDRAYSIKDVKIEGISKITPQAIELAKLDGYVIKHLAILEGDDVIVEPRMIKKDSILNVNGTLNVIELNTKYAGSIYLIGNGAGGFEAASAILNDLIYIIKERKKIEKVC
ncbi:MAG: homoserine dehydrogenase [Candidatus Thorarchaeota archaeon]